MLRDINLDEISDGRLYTSNDMAKTDCKGCDGCSACCHGMGSSIVLDPLDVCRLSQGLQQPVNRLLAGPLELHVVDGIILPNLKMTGTEEACSFLDSDGRCSIHAFRPGICRMFPLGRFYEDHTFKYFLQIHECPKTDRTKVKIKKWLDTPDLKQYEKFVWDWHQFLLDVQEIFYQTEDTELIRNLNMYVLSRFYYKVYEEKRDFYEQFYERLEEAKKLLSLGV